MPPPPPPAAATSDPVTGPGCVLALDVGGTGMKGAVLDRGLRAASVLRRPTPRAAGPDAVVEEIAAALDALHGLARDRGLPVRAAGVVVPGIVDEAAGRAVRAVNIGWRDLPLAALLEERTRGPVALGHDVRAGSLAETVAGAGRGARDVLFVALGTGVASAVVGDGRVVSAGGHAGELGHVVVEPGGARCACGGRGCLETVASAAAVAAAYTARSGRAVEGAAAVAALVARGDRVAREVWERAADALAAALATATTLLGTELIVLGGGLARAGGLLLDPVREGLARRLTFQRPPAVTGAAFGDRAGCVGAGVLAWRRADAGAVAA